MRVLRRREPNSPAGSSSSEAGRRYSPASLTNQPAPFPIYRLGRWCLCRTLLLPLAVGTPPKGFMRWRRGALFLIESLTKLSILGSSVGPGRSPSGVFFSNISVSTSSFAPAPPLQPRLSLFRLSFREDIFCRWQLLSIGVRQMQAPTCCGN